MIFNIFWPKKKFIEPYLRQTLRVSEKHIKLIARIVDFFSPQSGFVCDPFAGTVKLAYAAAGRGRQSVSIERETTCFSAALSRICQIQAVNGYSKHLEVGAQNIDLCDIVCCLHEKIYMLVATFKIGFSNILGIRTAFHKIL